MKVTQTRSSALFPVFLACVFAAPAACLHSVQADTYEWVNMWGGEYDNPQNWSPSGVPGSSDAAVFDHTQNIFIHLADSVTASRQLSVKSGITTLLLGVPGDGCDEPALYRLLGSGGFINGAVSIGGLPDVPATLRIRDTVSSCGPDSYVIADGLLTIAQAEDSIGTLVLGDSRAQATLWTSAYPAIVGVNGDGSLEIQDADRMNNSSATLGMGAGAVGTASIWGTWTNNGILTIGDGGTGTMSVYHTVTNTGDAYIAKKPGSVGTVNVAPDWEQSYDPQGWQCEGSLYVGGDDQSPGGTGSITLSESGLIQVEQETTVWSSSSIGVSAGTFQANDVNIRGGGTVSVGGVLGDWMAATFNCTNLEIWAGGILDINSADGHVDCDTLHSLGMTEVTGGHLHVTDQFSATPSSVVRLLHGTIAVPSLSGFHGSLVWQNGTVNVTADGVVIDDGEPLGNDLSIGTATSLSVAGELGVGSVSNGVMTITSDGAVTSGTGAVGSLSGDAVTGYAEVSGPFASWTMIGDLRVRGVNDARLSLLDGATMSNGSAHLASKTGTTAEVSLDAVGTEWNCSGALYAGGDSATAGGTGTLDVGYGAAVTVAGNMKVWDDFVVEIDDGTIITTDLDIAGQVHSYNTGMLDIRGGRVDIDGAGTLDSMILGNGSTSVFLNDADASWSMPGPLLVGATVQGVGHVNELTLSPGATVTAAAQVTVPDNAKLALAGGTINAAVINLYDSDLMDHGTLNGDFLTTGSVLATGDLVIGDADSSSGVQIGGEIETGSHRVTLRKQGALLVSNPISIGGGTLTVPDGLRLTGGANVTGFGVIDTPDDPATRLINDDSIVGSWTSQRIELTGYVTGLGLLNNVTILGTDDPTFADPSAVDRGNVDYVGKLILSIEGLIAGTQYDQINHSGIAGLGGELIVELMNGFEPQPGDSFTILTYGSHTGQFDVLSLPALMGDLSWRVVYGPTSVTLTIDGPLPGDCDTDDDVDLDDYAGFMNCLAGPDTEAQLDCACFDVNNSGTVDLADFALLQASFTGAGS